MANAQWLVFFPILIYFAMVFAISYMSSRAADKAAAGNVDGDFLDDYLVGGRDLTGLPLAMTLVATYLSAGSFIGGPGVAYTEGLAWIFLAMAQMPTGYFAFMILGKKFAIVSRKINANTINDFLRERYESKLLIVLTSIGVTAFFIAAMSAQWVGAARMLQGSVGIEYKYALTIFAFIVVVYTSIGGFKGVVLTDLLQGTVMLLGTVLLLFGVLRATGGVSEGIQQMKAIDPNLLSPFGAGTNNMTKSYVTSFWVLVGFAIVGIPNVASRAMSYKDTKSLNQGIMYGMVVSLVLLLGMHFVGAFGRPILEGIGAQLDSGDLVVPTLASEMFPSALTGIVISGPLAAIMSTVAAQLLVVNGAIVNDLIANSKFGGFLKDRKKAAMTSILASVAIGLVVYAISLNPPELMVWLNLFASGGTITTFIWPIIFGLYWKRANKQGAIASVFAGVGSYVGFQLLSKIDAYSAWARPLGMHGIVLPLIISAIVMVVVSLATAAPKHEIIEKFWGVYKVEK